MKLLLICVVSSCCMFLSGNETNFSKDNYGFIRIFKEAEKSKKWKKQKTLAAKMMLIRKYALKHSVASNPLSSRYLLTCYGGAIDLVHFLGIGAFVCSNPSKHYDRLFQEWVAEGGYENKNGFNFKSPPEATPDDLPSNALGALWGYEINGENDNPNFDILESFIEFISPLKPVPDRVVKHISYKQAVLGLKKHYTKMDYNKRRAWFTSEPLLVCNLINQKARVINGKPFCKAVNKGRKALQEAGFKLYTYKNKPIIILRKDST